MKYLIMIAATALLSLGPSSAQTTLDPDDVRVGKPADISQEIFEGIRKLCKDTFKNDFHMRDYCEQKQFEAVRKLTGERK